LLIQREGRPRDRDRLSKGQGVPYDCTFETVFITDMVSNSEAFNAIDHTVMTSRTGLPVFPFKSRPMLVSISEWLLVAVSVFPVHFLCSLLPFPVTFRPFFPSPLSRVRPRLIDFRHGLFSIFPPSLRTSCLRFSLSRSRLAPALRIVTTLDVRSAFLLKRLASDSATLGGFYGREL